MIVHTEEKCGTYAGYQAHTAVACDACKAALAAYQREYRKHRPDVVERENAKQAARGRALWRLAAQYPHLFRRLCDEEMPTTGETP